MQRHRPHSAQTLLVLRALAADPSRWRYGYDLIVELGLKSGSLYPILIRLTDRGLMESAWESADPGRPPRHLYRLTSAGAAEAAALTKQAKPAAAHRARLGTA